jgi:cytochrome c553
MKRIAVALCLLLPGTQVLAGDINGARALSNYMLYCQGCHTPDGMGGKSVPRLNGRVGRFLKLPAGRDYLVRVPGAATSILSDRDLAEVMNWIILKFGGTGTPEEFRHYTPEEVGKLRSRPLLELTEHRRKIMEQLAQETGADTAASNY